MVKSDGYPSPCCAGARGGASRPARNITPAGVTKPLRDTESVVLAYAVRALEQWIGGDPGAAVADADRGVQIGSHWDRRFLAQALGTQALVHAVTGDRPTDRPRLRPPAGRRICCRESPGRRGGLPGGAESLAGAGEPGQVGDAVGVLDEAAADLPQAVGRDSPAPLRFSINLGWAALGAGDLARDWANFVHSLSRGGPVNPDRESAEVLLGHRLRAVRPRRPGGRADAGRRRGADAAAGGADVSGTACRGGPGGAFCRWPAGAVVDSESDGALVQRLRELVDGALRRP